MVKRAVCKTVIHRFESDFRLHFSLFFHKFSSESIDFLKVLWYNKDSSRKYSIKERNLKMQTVEGIKTRLAVLKGRQTQNANIIRKLERQLRNLEKKTEKK